MPAFSSYLSDFLFSTVTSPPNFVSIPNITSISFSGIAATEIDVTALDSVGKTYVLGTRDNGTVEITAFVNRTTAPFMPVSGNSTPGLFTAALGDSQTSGSQYIAIAGGCYLQSTAIEGTVDNAVTVTYTFRLTGTITVSAATAP
jgi:hypothetical protein